MWKYLDYKGYCCINTRLFYISEGKFDMDRYDSGSTIVSDKYNKLVRIEWADGLWDNIINSALSRLLKGEKVHPWLMVLLTEKYGVKLNVIENYCIRNPWNTKYPRGVEEKLMKKLLNEINEVIIVASKRVCTICGDEMWSKERHDYVTCKCGACSLDGGLAYTHWGGPSVDASVYSDDDFSIIRQNELRGGRGVNGDQPLTWVPIANMSDNWLKSTIKYLEDRNMAYGRHYKHLLMEVKYREVNGISISE